MCIVCDYKWTDLFRHAWSTYRYNIKNKSKVCPAPHLAVSVGVLLKVLLFTNDRLCDDVVILDTHSGREGGAVSLCQPGDLLGLLIILREEIITKCYNLSSKRSKVSVNTESMSLMERSRVTFASIGQ